VVAVAVAVAAGAGIGAAVAIGTGGHRAAAGSRPPGTPAAPPPVTGAPPAVTGATPAPAVGGPLPCAATPPDPGAPVPEHAGGGPAVPGRPVTARLCRYAGLSTSLQRPLVGQRLISDGPTVDRLRADLDGLAPFPATAFHCPEDDASAIVVRFAPAPTVTAWLTGCPRLAAPSGAFQLSARALADLEVLVPAQL
jgi:hypothetical protein